MEGETQAPKQSWLQKQKQKFLPQRGKPTQLTEVVATPTSPHLQEQSVIPVHQAEVAQPETELPRQQSIDQYNRAIHREAASRIEPRLVNLPEEEAQQRRNVIGIINA